MSLQSLRQMVLASNLIWRLSGISYSTAVVATHGRPTSWQGYLRECSAQMEILDRYIAMSKEILEFGCGIGGNLVSVGSKVQKGWGIDVNRGYIRIARRIALKANATNLTFIKYDGHKIPEVFFHRIDTAISIGVFERISKSKVYDLLLQLSNTLTTNGTLIVYLLSDRAKGSVFTQTLGDDAYTFWSDNEISSIPSFLEMDYIERISWPSNVNGHLQSNESYADVLVMRMPK